MFNTETLNWFLPVFSYWISLSLFCLQLTWDYKEVKHSEMKGELICLKQNLDEEL